MMTTVQLFQEKDIFGFLQRKIKIANCDPWLFIYIPETISYAVLELFADILQPDSTIKADKEDGKLEYDMRMSLALERFAQSQAFITCRFVAGHFKVFQIDEVAALTNSRLMTVIRDPVDRLLSDFGAQNRSNEGLNTSQAFLNFAKRTENQNVLLQFLCPKRMWKPKECIDFIQNRFDFIGVAEDLPMTLKMFYAIHGARFHANPQNQNENMNMNMNKLTRSDLSPELIKTVSLLNAVDYEIFRYFHDNFVSLKEAFFAQSDSGKLFEDLVYRSKS